MEGTPKQFDEHSPEEQMSTYIMYVDSLNLTPEEKGILKSIVKEKTAGELAITLDLENNHIKKVTIDPSKTDIELIDKISEALDDLYTITLSQKERDVFTVPDHEEKLSVAFYPARFH